MTKEEILKMPTSECNCEQCIIGCADGRPCWGTIEDMEIIIDEGFADRLMLDFWNDCEEGNRDIYLLVPALCGYEKKSAPHWPIGRCNFLNDKNMCDIHKVKPVLGKITNHENFDNGMHNIIAQSWDCKKGMDLIERWKKLIEFNGIVNSSNNCNVMELMINSFLYLIRG